MQTYNFTEAATNSLVEALKIGLSDDCLDPDVRDLIAAGYSAANHEDWVSAIGGSVLLDNEDNDPSGLGCNAINLLCDMADWVRVASAVGFTYTEGE